MGNIEMGNQSKAGLKSKKVRLISRMQELEKHREKYGRPGDKSIQRKIARLKKELKDVEWDLLSLPK